MTVQMIAAAVAGTAGAALLATKGRARLTLSRAKHKSLAGHVRMAKRIASFIPFYEFDEHAFFRADRPPEDVAVRREAGFRRLSDIFHTRCPKSIAMTAEARACLSDLQFTGAYRVPFQFSRIARQQLPVGAFVQSSQGVTVTDLDGNVYYDLTGSYGVNLFGNRFTWDIDNCSDKGSRSVLASNIIVTMTNSQLGLPQRNRHQSVGMFEVH